MEETQNLCTCSTLLVLFVNLLTIVMEVWREQREMVGGRIDILHNPTKAGVWIINMPDKKQMCSI